eukprot:TRINITY_DN47142_c0_g1_i1.p1 TRINITY_DN47142_c0_g1~~TRINITY_DN47142_c0_g1_i1.p1  ORF type:complete len:1477 (+),score=493.73 TRINITY_DN47142_c0_g1_i1:76-4506(+)
MVSGEPSGDAADSVAQWPGGLPGLRERNAALAEWLAGQSAADQEALALLWLVDGQRDAEAAALRRDIARQWIGSGLVDLAPPAAPPPRPPSPPPQPPPPFASLEQHRRSVREHWKATAEERRRKHLDTLRRELRERHWRAAMRELPDSTKEHTGEIVWLDERLGKGDIFVRERACSTPFLLDIVDYGLKTVRQGDRVQFTVDAGQRLVGSGAGKQRPRVAREWAIGVRPVGRQLTPNDVADFCRACRMSPRPSTVLKRIITSLDDWHRLLTYLGQQPAEIGPPYRGQTMTWEDAVSCIVELGTYPELQETRFRNVLGCFYRACSGTALLPTAADYEAGITLQCGLLLKLAARLQPENPRSIHLAMDLALFTENMRIYLFGMQRGGRRVRWKFYETMCTCLMHFQSKYAANAKSQGAMDLITKERVESLHERLTTLAVGLFDYHVFPSPKCFTLDPTSNRHPMHPAYLGKADKRAWYRPREYVNTHLSLLKADCFNRSVRSILCRLDRYEGADLTDEQRVDLCRNTHLHTDVRMVAECLGDNAPWFALRFTPPADGWSAAHGLGKNTLVCIMPKPGSQCAAQYKPGQVWWAVVPFADSSLLASNMVPVRLVDGDHDFFIRSLQQGGHYMFETRVFLFAFKPVLEALIHLSKQEHVPFEKWLMRGWKLKNPVLPRYIQRAYRTAFCDIVDRMLNNPANKFDSGQQEALRRLSTHPVLLIQGPPGTGKSFIGCRLVEVITEFRIRLRNGELRNDYDPDLESGAEERRIDPLDGCLKNRNEFFRKVPGRPLTEWAAAHEPETRVPGPVMVLTFKNHALDEFLVDVLSTWEKRGWDKRVCRLGSRSKEPRLKEYNLISQTKPPSNSFRQQIRSMRLAMQRLSSEVAALDEGQLTEAQLRRLMSDHQQQLLPPEELAAQWSEWLGGTLPCSPLAEVPTMRERLTRSSDAVAAERRNVEGRQQRPAAPEAPAEDEGVRKSNFAQVASEREDFEAQDGEDGHLNFRAKQFFNRSLLPIAPQWCADVAKLVDPQRPDEVPQPDTASATDLNKLSAAQRRVLTAHWISVLRMDAVKDYRRKKEEFEGLLAMEQFVVDDARLQVLKNSDVIGVTTTGAALYQGLLRAVQPSVIIVEEAAEILEAQVLSCLVNSVAQVVLIGDHFQLQPSVDTEVYARKNHFNVSMFQRLIERVGLPSCILTEQRRMCKQVADLVRPIYRDPPLEDHEGLQRRMLQFGPERTATLPGLCNPVVFWTHTHPEEASVLGLSKMNTKEVDMVLFLVRFLLGPNNQPWARLRPHQLTVLSPYQGQMRHLRQRLRQGGYPSVAANTTTVDSFQGDENDVVIVSMVRTEKLTSFMRLQNRMVVACSRARFAFIMVGSSELLAKAKHWEQTVGIIRSQCPDAVGPELQLRGAGGRVLRVPSEAESFPDPCDPAAWSAGPADGAARKRPRSPPAAPAPAAAPAAGGADGSRKRPRSPAGGEDEGGD